MNENLSKAKAAKNDEFYTQYIDIEKEVMKYIDYNKDVFKDKIILLPCDDPEWSNFTRFFAQNFKSFGIKKLISTSYAPMSKAHKNNYEATLFEMNDPQYDAHKTQINGKIFTLTRDIQKDNRIDIDDLEWKYLEGDGDFRSDEIKKLRDEADMIITNPPFSLFREFLAWIMESNKKLLIIGNINAITYKEVFPLIKDNRIWLGAGKNDGRNIWYQVPNNFDNFHKEEDSKKYAFVAGTCWYTNLEHGRRHEALGLMTMEDNIKHSKHKEIRAVGYTKYDNYDAIEVPFVDAIPSDYGGAMGVPISFLAKYNPEQFVIIKFRHGDDNKDLRLVNGVCPYFRVLIKHKTQ